MAIGELDLSNHFISLWSCGELTRGPGGGTVFISFMRVRGFDQESH